MKDTTYIWMIAAALLLYVFWDNLGSIFPTAAVTNKSAGNAPGQFGG